MLRRSPRALALWAAAAVVAIVTTLLVVSTLSSLRHQDETYGRVHAVLVARRDLPVGTRLRAGDVATREIRGDAPAPDAATAIADVIGRVIRVPVLRDTTITARHLTASRRDSLGDAIPDGRRAVRLVVEHGLRPDPGDLVDVLATFDPQTLGDRGDPTIVVAPAVTVLAVDTEDDAGDSIAVTVLVTPRQSTRLAFAAAAGTIGLALAPPEAATAAG
jgi:Flp pilus assembly protein CpaB